MVHLEEIAVAFLDDVLAEALDGVGEVEVHGHAGRPDAVALVATLLGGPGGDVARHQVAEGRVAALEEVVALGLGDVPRLALVGLGLGHPHAAVVAQRFAHQRQLGLGVAQAREAGGVDLREAGVGEEGPALVAAPRGGDVAVHGVGGEVEHGGVAAGAEQHGVAGVLLDLAGDQVAAQDALGHAVHDGEVEHFALGEDAHRAGVNLAHERAVRAEQELLAGLAAGVEGALELRAAEGAGVEQAAVLAGEGHAEGDAVVDDVAAHLGEAVHVGLAGAEVAALDGVVEEAVDRVAVVAVVLRGVDAALRGDGVGAAGRIVDGEGLDVVAEFAEGGGGRRAGQAGADHQHGVLALVGGIHQPGVVLVGLPLFGQRAGRNAVVQHAGCLGGGIGAHGWPPVTGVGTVKKR